MCSRSAGLCGWDSETAERGFDGRGFLEQHGKERLRCVTRQPPRGLQNCKTCSATDIWVRPVCGRRLENSMPVEAGQWDGVGPGWKMRQPVLESND